MKQGVYHFNKGVNRPVEFKGLKAQYLVYLAAGMVIMLIVFAVMYLSGVPSYLCVLLAFAGGCVLVYLTYRLSRKYGQYGLMKRSAHRRLPEVIVSHYRTAFRGNCTSVDQNPLKGNSISVKRNPFDGDRQPINDKL